MFYKASLLLTFASSEQRVLDINRLFNIQHDHLSEAILPANEKAMKQIFKDMDNCDITFCWDEKLREVSFVARLEKGEADYE